jgi:RNA polymerase sigma factor (sigma-70 family)
MDSTINALREQQIEQCKPWITEMARRHGVEDLYQEVWVQCLQLGRAEVDWTIPQHDRIRAIARRQWLGERRRSRRRPQAFSECSVDPFGLPDQEDSTAPLERLLRDEAFATAVTALARCDRRQRMALEQHFLKSVPDAVIAARWRVGVEAIRRWRSKAIRRLQAILETVA